MNIVGGACLDGVIIEAPSSKVYDLFLWHTISPLSFRTWSLVGKVVSMMKVKFLPKGIVAMSVKLHYKGERGESRGERGQEEGMGG